MIKQIEFASRGPEASFDEFASSWREIVVQGAWAPQADRPLRAAVCLPLPDRDASRHDGIALRWFIDEAHLERFEKWRTTAAVATDDDGVTDAAAAQTIVAEEVVLRGAEWLEQRWREGGEKLKHMALARRASGLTPAEFSETWRGRAGVVKKAGATTATVIPDAARGLAYVQNHPVARREDEWAYDAVNEVYFDDLESLRVREDWFAANLDAAGEDDLIGEHWFLSVTEEVLDLSGRNSGSRRRT
jgi:hypothetical protein